MRVKFIYPPRLYGLHKLGYPPVHHHIPPLSLPMMVSYLRSNGIRAEQDDLDIRNFHLWFERSAKAADLTPFLDKTSIVDALDTGKGDVLFDAAEKSLRLTKTRGYDVLGFSLMDEYSLPALGITLLMARLVKERHDSFIMVGGSGVNCLVNSDLMKNAGSIDAVIRSDHAGTLNFLSMVQDRGRDLERSHFDADIFSPSSVERLQRRVTPSRWQFWLRRRGKEGLDPVPLDTEKRAVADLLPAPVFDGLPLDLYRFTPEDMQARGSRGMLILPYTYLSECQGRCAFCHFSWSTFHRHKDPHLIVEELERLSMKHHTRHFYFTNANFNPTKEFAHSLCDELIRRDLGLQWSDCANLMMADKGLFPKLREAGAARLIFGLECPSDEMLRWIGKALTVAQAETLLRASHDAGIWTEIEIICGFPQEEWRHTLLTEKFLRRNREVIDHYYLNQFYLHPASRMFSEPSRYGIENLRENPAGVGWAFDEADGLGWKERQEAGRKSFEYLFRLRQELYQWAYNGFEDSFLKLFYLMDVLKEREKVAAHLRQHPSIYDRWEQFASDTVPEFCEYPAEA